MKTLIIISMMMISNLALGELDSIKFKAVLKGVDNDNVAILMQNRRVILPRRIFEEKDLQAGTGKEIEFRVKRQDLKLLFEKNASGRSPASSK